MSTQRQRLPKSSIEMEYGPQMYGVWPRQDSFFFGSLVANAEKSGVFIQNVKLKLLKLEMSGNPGLIIPQSYLSLKIPKTRYGVDNCHSPSQPSALATQ